jgi:hypothetical protein
MKANQLLPGNVAWTSPTSLGMDQDGQVYLNTQAECVFSGLPRKPTQSAKVYMGDGEVSKVELPVTWTNALPVLGFKNKVKVKEIKGR